MCNNVSMLFCKVCNLCSKNRQDFVRVASMNSSCNKCDGCQGGYIRCITGLVVVIDSCI
jgi:hypothetical protein